ncbi:hypothetical protein AOQ84DRAFT_435143 [Glonium stellatum]|uniref:DUF3074 domain-containing protein n=1 Tax=Glonium stellatum TaxID=574774 RepID=A0A8E2JZC9_9PEZI|nr:hypothetical protein AOQ84DRAFT_435143 [Glonium stellatum]
MPSNSAMRILRLQPLPISVLPFHPALQHKNSADHPSTRSFARTLLNQAAELSSEVPTWEKAGVTNSLETGSVDTAIYQHTITPPGEAEKEHWVARISRHENKPVASAASYAEFRRGIKDESNKHELEYIPPMESYNELVRYEGLEGDLADLGAVAEIKEVDIRVYENIYKMAPSLPRFAIPVLIVTALTSDSSFLVVTVPVTDTSVLLKSRIPELAGPDGILTYFTAVTKVRVIEEGQVEWMLATAVEGTLGMSREQQAEMMKEEVARDVGRFVDWVAGKREGEGKDWEGDAIVVG